MKALILIAVLTATSAWAADDPSIKGELRQEIKVAMDQHIKATTVEGRYVIYDAIEGELLRLKFAELHEGVVKKGDFFVSCADFTVGDHKYDLDFLVGRKGEKLRVFQALVHKVDGDKRPYHLEDQAE